MELIEVIYSVVIFFLILFTTVFSFSYISYRLKQKGKQPKTAQVKNVNPLPVSPARDKTVHNVPVIKSSNSNRKKTTEYHKHQHKLQQTKEVPQKSKTPEQLRKKRVQRIVDLTNQNKPANVKKAKTVDLPKQKITKTNTLEDDLLNKYMDDYNDGMNSIIKKTKIR
ncbi:MAG: hypothetical protein JEY94_02765 [Melioribacteraceae bacterium]|nr:hypothetical protein [Melioribacteraceae bacterium]